MQLSKTTALLAGCISIYSTSNALANPDNYTIRPVESESFSFNDITYLEQSQKISNATARQNSNVFMLVDGILKLPTLQQRRGNRSKLTFEETNALHASWLRIETLKFNYGDPRSTLLEVDSERSLVQVGVDFHGHENTFGKWIFGLTGQYATTASDLKFIPLERPLESKTLGIGGTATLYDQNGAYIDWQLQYNRVTESGEFSVSNQRFAGSLSSTYTAGVEFGRPYVLMDDFFIVPQGHIRWASTFRDKAELPVVENSRLDQIDGISVRASSAIEYVGQSTKAYFVGNLYYDTTRYWKIHYNGRTRDTSSGPMSYEYGIGLQFAVTEEFAFHFDSSYRGDFEENPDFETKIVRLEIGIRHNW